MNFSKFLEDIRLKRKLNAINKRKYNIFAIYHKPWVLHKNSVVTPIHAGRVVAMNAAKDGMISEKDLKWMKSHMIGDDSGINISDKNRYFSEVTATYWMWKNVKSKYVGLMHYRRIFDMTFGAAQREKSSSFPTKFGITQQNLDNIFKNYDIILPSKLGFDISLYDQYLKHHYKEDIDFVLDYVISRYPHLKEYVEKIKVSNIGYFYNMFIAPKEIFNEYAEFLFDVLFAFSRQLKERNSRAINQQRAEGYLAERLSGIYFDYLVNERNLKVKEFPVVWLPEDVLLGRRPGINIVRFAVRNKKGKGISIVLRVKM